jgi:sulfite reductase alpha subunit-like flavoprotein
MPTPADPRSPDPLPPSGGDRGGHPSEDFLSAAAGFLPEQPPVPALSPAFAAWDELAGDLVALVGQTAVEPAIRQLPVLDARELPPGERCRAASLLGIFVHALVRERQLCGHPSPAELPPQLARPWEVVAHALGRPGLALTYSDLILYNWRPRDGATGRRLPDLALATPVYGTAEERIFYLVMVETHAVAAPLVSWVPALEQALAASDGRRLEELLCALEDLLSRLTFDTLLQIDPNPLSPTAVDPLVWAKTVAPFAAPVHAGELGLSGGGSPVFHALDALFGRERWDGPVGHELQALARWLPPRVAGFVARCRSLALPSRVQTLPATVRHAFRAAFEAYAGPRGWLGIHRLKVYGFMEVGFRSGRTATNGGFAGDVHARSWDALDATLEAAREERWPLAPGDPGSTCPHAGGAATTATAAAAKPADDAPASSCPFARRTATTPAATAPIARVELATEGQGIRHRPGDRLSVWPVHREELVTRTLAALAARGDEPLQLTASWRRHLARRGRAAVEELPLGEFLRLARLRPLDRGAAKFLATLAPVPRLTAILAAREEDRHELWEALALLARANYDVRRLWRAAAWQSENLARVVPPDRARIYSIASAPRADGQLELTVGELRYTSPDATAPPSDSPPSETADSEPQPTRPPTAVLRQGTASHALTAPAAATGPALVAGSDGAPVGRHGRVPAHPPAEEPLAVGLVRPSRFGLPVDPRQPLLMIAGGTGLAPFRSFWQARRAAPERGPAWLFVGTREPGSLPFADELAAEVRAGNLELRVAFSRVDRTWQSDRRELREIAAPASHVDRALLAEAATVGDLLLARAAGGQEGVVYLCGQSRFAATALAALTAILAQHRGLPSDHPEVERQLQRIAAQGRLRFDIFTTFAPATAPGSRGYRSIDTSEVILRNQPESGFWTVVQGQVYDLGPFLGLHPGGERILRASAGLDATRSYEQVGHHLEPEVHAMLDLYKIGKVRRLELGQRWAMSIAAFGDRVAAAGGPVSEAGVNPAGAAAAAPPATRPAREPMRLLHYSLEELFRHWVRLTYRVVEVENVLAAAVSLDGATLTCPPSHQSSEGSATALGDALLAEQHRLFAAAYLPALTGRELDRLWRMTLGFVARDRPLEALADALAAEWRALAPWLAEPTATPRSAAAADHVQSSPPLAARRRHVLSALAADRALLARIKQLLRGGLLQFEQHEEHVVARAGGALLDLLAALPAELTAYRRALVADDPAGSGGASSS